ncbi:MAG: MBL fold metallo-hydrolase [Bacillota bacterium]|nr:MBL fold metallo-hydrolase [Bacillota bacterium]
MSVSAPDLRIRYFGWSTVLVEGDGLRLVFDPFWNSLYDTRWATVEDFTGVEAIVLSHGHNEHFIDTPKLFDHTGADVYGPAELMPWLAEMEGLPVAKLHGLAAGDRVRLGGAELQSFAWSHREVSRSRYLSGDAVFGMRFAAASALLAPPVSSYLGYVLRLANGLCIVNLAEGMNPGLSDGQLAALVGLGYGADVLLAGAQLSFTAACARVVAALRPRQLLLYHPHQVLFERLGLASAPPGDFLTAAREAWPEIEAGYLEPGDSFEIVSRV